jgi:hypothetical protein
VPHLSRSLRKVGYHRPQPDGILISSPPSALPRRFLLEYDSVLPPGPVPPFATQETTCCSAPLPPPNSAPAFGGHAPSSLQQGAACFAFSAKDGSRGRALASASTARTVRHRDSAKPAHGAKENLCAMGTTMILTVHVVSVRLMAVVPELRTHHADDAGGKPQEGNANQQRNGKLDGVLRRVGGSRAAQGN